MKIGTDVRPVFAKERLLLEVLLGEPFKFAESSIWFAGANNYVVDGNKVKMPFVDFRKLKNKVSTADRKAREHNDRLQNSRIYAARQAT